MPADSFPESWGKLPPYFAKINELCDNLLAQTNFAAGVFKLVSELFNIEAILVDKIIGANSVNDRVVYVQVKIPGLFFIIETFFSLSWTRLRNNYTFP